MNCHRTMVPMTRKSNVAKAMAAPKRGTEALGPTPAHTPTMMRKTMVAPHEMSQKMLVSVCTVSPTTLRR